MNTIQIIGNSDIGLSRTDNQDTFICKKLWSGEDALLAVIDGVGGYTGGKRAASIAKERIIQYMTSPKGSTLMMLREAVTFANNEIVKEKKDDFNLSNMCCVLSVAVANSFSEKLFFVHVGDTRIYRYRNGILQKLSKDHSFVGSREDAGYLTEVEAMSHPRRNEIFRDVGSVVHRIDDSDFLDYDETDFRPDDILLICSDGLSDMVTSHQIMSILIGKDPLFEKIKTLISLANNQGGKDNITLVLAKNSALCSESSNTNFQSSYPQALPDSENFRDCSGIASSIHRKKSAFHNKYKWFIPTFSVIIFIIIVWLIYNVLNSARLKKTVQNRSSNENSLSVNKAL